MEVPRDEALALISAASEASPPPSASKPKRTRKRKSPKRDAINEAIDQMDPTALGSLRLDKHKVPEIQAILRNREEPVIVSDSEISRALRDRGL